MLLKDLFGWCRRGQEGKQGKAEVMEVWARMVAMRLKRGYDCRPALEAELGLGVGREGSKEDNSFPN